jgi:hypothetical protein
VLLVSRDGVGVSLSGARSNIVAMLPGGDGSGEQKVA